MTEVSGELFLVEDMILYIASFCTIATRVMLSSTNKLFREQCKPLSMRDSDIPAVGAEILDKTKLPLLNLIAEDSSLGLFQHFYDLDYIWGLDTVSIALSSRSLKMVEWAWEEFSRKYCDYNAKDAEVIGRTVTVEKFVELAAKRGDIEIVKWWRVKVPTRVPANIVSAAAHSGSLELLEWLMAEGYKITEGADLPAARRRDFALLEFLVNHNYTWHKRVTEYGALSGDVNVVIWLLDHGAPLPSTCGAACKTGNREMVELFRARGVRFSVDSFTLAVKKSSVDFLEWLLTVRCPFNRNVIKLAITEAIKENRLDVLQWLHARNYQFDDNIELNNPLEYLLLSAQITTTIYGADSTLIYPPNDPLLLMASHGSLEMVKWMSSVGGTFDAQAALYAARGGKLDTLQWLHKEMGIELHSKLIQKAFPTNPGVVRWLRAQDVPWPAALFQASVSLTLQ